MPAPAAQAPTPLPIMEMMSGVWVSKTVAAANDLDLFTKLSGRPPQTVEQIARLTGLSRRPAESLVVGCASLGLLRRAADGYVNSPLSERYLVRTRPDYFGGWVEVLDRHDHPGWMRLTEALREDHPTVWDSGERTSLFDGMEPGMVEVFWEGMCALSRFTAAALADTLDLSGTRALLDVGGGGAAFDLELCARHPGLRAAVYDLPFVCDLTRPKIEKAGMADRITLIPGDFFAEPRLPSGYDTLLLSSILHDWNDDDARTILAKCFAALPSGGRLLICELLLNEERDGPPEAALMGLTMLVWTWGRGFSAGELTDWLSDTGFTSVTVDRFTAPGANAVITATKP
ncbi:Ubiquinone/menaquinone biosynthesis C-methylase UbiE [Nonomuraea solani]|uniref:Ubiquinone/menaquinone biosynthesis C-methylase UbiE n=2 Tax=Nonomuraea solani TaxID=1144553 RepID=A0A1H6DXS9_9ACTN|nr:Ubiquinone/menaquinone biosynthesis C-methylase UbiE [Nonomuraea solani]